MKNLLLSILIFTATLLLPFKVSAISPEAEEYCRNNAQGAAVFGAFEVNNTYNNCILAMQQRELNKINVQNCVQFGISCSKELEARDAHDKENTNKNNSKCQQQYDSDIAHGVDGMSAAMRYSHCIQY